MNFFTIATAAAWLMISSFSLAATVKEDPCTPHLVESRSSQTQLLLQTLAALEKGAAVKSLRENNLQLQRVLSFLHPQRDVLPTEAELASVESLFLDPQIQGHANAGRLFNELMITALNSLNMQAGRSPKQMLESTLDRLLLQRIFLAGFTHALSQIDAGPAQNQGEVEDPALFSTLKLLNRKTLKRLFQTSKLNSEETPWILKVVDEEWLTQIQDGVQIPGRLEISASLSLSAWGLLTRNALLSVIEQVQPELLTRSTPPSTLKPSPALLKQKAFVQANEAFLFTALAKELTKGNPQTMTNLLEKWQLPANRLSPEGLKLFLQTLCESKTIHGEWILAAWNLSFASGPSGNSALPARVMPQVSAALVDHFTRANREAEKTLERIAEWETQNLAHGQTDQFGQSRNPVLLPAIAHYDTFTQQLNLYLYFSRHNPIEAEAAYKILDCLNLQLKILPHYLKNSVLADDPVVQKKWQELIDFYQGELKWFTIYFRSAPLGE